MALTISCREGKTEAFLLPFVQGIWGWANTPSQGHRDWTESLSHGKENDLSVYREYFLISVDVEYASELGLGLSLELFPMSSLCLGGTHLHPTHVPSPDSSAIFCTKPSWFRLRKKKSSFYSSEILMCFVCPCLFEVFSYTFLPCTRLLPHK